MKQAEVRVHDRRAGVLIEIDPGRAYEFHYDDTYGGAPVSLTMPIDRRIYRFTCFPPFFEGLLPEGYNLEALLRICKIDRYDLWRQLMTVGADTVGAVTIFECR